MPDVIIRKMMEKDLESVVAIEKEVFPDPWNYDAFKSDLNNEMAWPLVSLVDGKVAGYSCIYIVMDETQIGNFAVSPDHRKLGIGKKMMDEVIKIALNRKCKNIFLEVRESNKPAQALYISFGFKAAGRRSAYYRHPVENAIIMVKEL